MKHLIVWARPVAVLPAPLPVACFSKPARSEAIRRLVEELSANFGDGLAGQAAAVVG